MDSFAAPPSPAQHEARAAAVEEREVAERVEVRQAEHVAIPLFGGRGVADGARDLSDGLRCGFFFGIGCSRGSFESALSRGASGNQARSARRSFNSQLQRARWRTWNFTAFTLTPRRRAISAFGHAVLHGVNRAPFGRRQPVRMRRPAASVVWQRPSFAHRRAADGLVSLPPQAP